MKEFLLTCTYSVDEVISLYNKTVPILHEIVVTQCASAAPQVLVARSPNSGSSGYANGSLHVIDCHHFLGKCLLEELLQTCILCFQY
jgi:hypothetical protein